MPLLVDAVIYLISKIVIFSSSVLAEQVPLRSMGLLTDSFFQIFFLFFRGLLGLNWCFNMVKSRTSLDSLRLFFSSKIIVQFCSVAINVEVGFKERAVDTIVQ